jgi:hypothetical protein
MSWYRQKRSYQVCSKMIKFNVGGKKFSTTTFTLHSKGSNFLTSMVQCEEKGKIQTIKDDEGCIFIDRNPEIFSIVLEYLRTGKLFISSAISKEQILSEFEYFGIDLQEKVKYFTTFYFIFLGN